MENVTILKKLKNLARRYEERDIMIESNSSIDGRKGSDKNEEVVTDFLKQQSDNITSKNSNRDFLDFGYKFKGVEYPVNVKITSCSSSDNAAGLSHLSYCLFGHSSVNKETKFLAKLKSCFGSSFFETTMLDLSDYYYFVCVKDETRAFVSSLLTMPWDCININPKNGIQVYWSYFKNSIESDFGKELVIQRNKDESARFLTILYLLWRAEIYKPNQKLNGISFEQAVLEGNLPENIVKQFQKRKKQL